MIQSFMAQVWLSQPVSLTAGSDPLKILVHSAIVNILNPENLVH